MRFNLWQFQGYPSYNISMSQNIFLHHYSSEYSYRWPRTTLNISVYPDSSDVGVVPVKVYLWIFIWW